MNPIRVLVVDDAVVVRRLITDALSSDPEIQIVGTASNGRLGVQRVEQLKPDIVTLDIEMPDMDGLEALQVIRKSHPRLPIIMFSTLTERGGKATLEALARGATDYVTKPANVGGITEGIQRCRDELLPKIRALCGRKAAPAPSPANSPGQTTAPRKSSLFPNPSAPRQRTSAAVPADALVIGVSTGGPVALAKIIPTFPAAMSVPIFIVQHMPPVFTRLMAERLDSSSPLKIIEGEPGMIARPGHVYIAPGGFHMVVVRRGENVAIELNHDAPENSCRPAVDVLFRSAVNVYGPRLAAAVLTGMGSDGAKGAEVIRNAGGTVYVQDEQSSVVWGMPGSVVSAGLADAVYPLEQIVPALIKRCRGHILAGGPGAAVA